MSCFSAKAFFKEDYKTAFSGKCYLFKRFFEIKIKVMVSGKNAIYKAKDIAYRTIQSALDNQSLEAMFKLTKYLSADRMLKHLHNITKDKTKKLIKQGTAKLVLPKSVSLAIDFHEKEYYGNKNHTEIIGSKKVKY